jgi:hypothetical protein
MRAASRAQATGRLATRVEAVGRMTGERARRQSPCARTGWGPPATAARPPEPGPHVGGRADCGRRPWVGEVARLTQALLHEADRAVQLLLDDPDGARSRSAGVVCVAMVTRPVVHRAQGRPRQHRAVVPEGPALLDKRRGQVQGDRELVAHQHRQGVIHEVRRAVVEGDDDRSSGGRSRAPRPRGPDRSPEPRRAGRPAPPSGRRTPPDRG